MKEDLRQFAIREMDKTLGRIEAQTERLASEQERLDELYKELADDFAAVNRYSQ